MEHEPSTLALGQDSTFHADSVKLLDDRDGGRTNPKVRLEQGSDAALTGVLDEEEQFTQVGAAKGRAGRARQQRLFHADFAGQHVHPMGRDGGEGWGRTASTVAARDGKSMAGFSMHDVDDVRLAYTRHGKHRFFDTFADAVGSTVPVKQERARHTSKLKDSSAALEQQRDLIWGKQTALLQTDVRHTRPFIGYENYGIFEAGQKFKNHRRAMLAKVGRLPRKDPAAIEVRDAPPRSSLNPNIVFNTEPDIPLMQRQVVEETRSLVDRNGMFNMQ